ncbi:hypothetical protein [Burkholderia sp. Ac-20365]|uniref:hypothetical protein n=1 Tax=Burkholderia sp. Ac-20365 TaxID=2703897 RepID=UPI00197C71A6|nr:hypothetical protein [Burkholderia sp. Ac-20365]MBN3766725.1 hypothetical protein [Burkholderia sp. Ac-20365]
MLFSSLRRLAAQLFQSTKGAPLPDPMWHGDHWQNLLSSPMDARHYVIEDWSLTPGLEFAPVGPDGRHQ